MARPKNQTPTYKLHTSTGLARTWIGGKWVTLGKYGTPESKEAFARVCAEHAVNPSAPVAVARGSSALTVDQVLVAFWRHAETYYDNKERTAYRYALAPVQKLYGTTSAANFGPLALKASRQEHVSRGLCRQLCNRYTNRIKRAFKWAVSEELISATVHHALQTLAPLKFGKTAAPEAEPVKPADAATVDATLPFLPHHVRAMIELMRYTGMRPGEVCSMTLNQIERAPAGWTYSPVKHKTAHHGKRRTIPFGPQARAVLAEFLSGRVLEPDELIFSPKRAREERFAAMRAARKTKVQPSQLSRKNPKATERMPTDRYTPNVISHTVAVACDKAFPHPTLGKRKGESAKARRARLTGEQKAELAQWQREHRWHPYQLRHSFATHVRKNYGLEAAQVLLGHSRADVTQVYAERNEELAATVAAKIG